MGGEPPGASAAGAAGPLAPAGPLDPEGPLAPAGMGGEPPGACDAGALPLVGEPPAAPGGEVAGEAATGGVATLPLDGGVVAAAGVGAFPDFGGPAPGDIVGVEGIGITGDLPGLGLAGDGDGGE